MERYYSTAEAARILNMSKDTVRRRADDGAIASVRDTPRGARHLLASSVEAYQQTLRMGHAAPAAAVAALSFELDGQKFHLFMPSDSFRLLDAAARERLTNKLSITLMYELEDAYRTPWTVADSETHPPFDDTLFDDDPLTWMDDVEPFSDAGDWDPNAPGSGAVEFDGHDELMWPGIDDDAETGDEAFISHAQSTISSPEEMWLAAQTRAAELGTQVGLAASSHQHLALILVAAAALDEGELRAARWISYIADPRTQAEIDSVLRWWNQGEEYCPYKELLVMDVHVEIERCSGDLAAALMESSLRIVEWPDDQPMPIAMNELDVQATRESA